MSEESLGFQIFMARLKAVLKRPDRVQYVDRLKNREALERLCLSEALFRKALGRLRGEHYKAGPEADHDGSDGSIWVFIYPDEGPRFYVKLKLYTVGAEDYLKILSFHD